MSLNFNIDDFMKWKQNQAIVKETDMDDLMRNEAKEVVATGIEKCSGQTGINVDAACKYIKEAMDKQFGNYWHCVMGEGYSFEVTR
jgi:dynein light chain 4